MNLLAILLEIFWISSSSSSSSCCCHAKKIDSHDLLIGDWEASVRLTTAGSRTGPGLRRQQPHAHRQHARNIPCRLSLYANGTFGLTDRRYNDPRVPIRPQPQPQPQPEQQVHSPSLLLIRGKWRLHTNPYCVTDRFYDTVLLETSVRRLPIRQVRLKLQCRLSGHFSNGHRRTFLQRRNHLKHDNYYYYARGKMTHGVVTLEEEEEDEVDPPIPNSDTTRSMADVKHTNIATISTPFRYLQQQYRQRRRQYRHSKRIVASFSALRYIPTYSDVISQSNDDDNDKDHGDLF